MEEQNYGNYIHESLINVFIMAGLALAIGSLINSMVFHIAYLSPIMTIVCFIVAGMAIYLRVCANKWANGASQVLNHEVMKHLRYKGNGQILDLGCGAGHLTVTAAKSLNRAKVVGVDNWKKHNTQIQCERNAKIDKVKKRVTFVKSDVTHLEMADGTYDAVISNYGARNNNVDPKVMVEEGLRVLKKGGSFCFQEKFGDDLEAYVATLKEQGFRVNFIANSEVQELIPKYMQKGPLKKTGLIYGTK